MLAWILVLAFLWTTAAFAILWLFARKKLQKLEAESTLAQSADIRRADHPSQAAPPQSAGFASNQEANHQAPPVVGVSEAISEDSAYKLIDLNSTIIDEEEYYFGVVRKENGGTSSPSSFLIKDDISHLTAGDSLTRRQGKVVKLDNASQHSDKTSLHSDNSSAINKLSLIHISEPTRPY